MTTIDDGSLHYNCLFFVDVCFFSIWSGIPLSSAVHTMMAFAFLPPFNHWFSTSRNVTFNQLTKRKVLNLNSIICHPFFLVQIWPDYMEKYCASSCGYCGHEGICADDVDLKGQCPHLKEAQGCDLEWMQQRCAKTCDTCEVWIKTTFFLYSLRDSK